MTHEATLTSELNKRPEKVLQIRKSKKSFYCDFVENWCGLDKYFLIDESQDRILTVLMRHVFFIQDEAVYIKR